MGTRRAAFVGVLLLVAFVVVVVITTPWHPLPGHVPGGHVSPDAARDFTAAQIARESAYHSAVRPWGLSSLGIWLVLVAVLGFTPLGARLVARIPSRRWIVRVVVAAAGFAAPPPLVLLPFCAPGPALPHHHSPTPPGGGGWFRGAVRRDR